jgi:hypothetical protein
VNDLIKQVSPQQMIRRATRLPVTGQTTSYRTGDDGDVKAGKARRFQVVGNLVYDWSTMLCWVANPAAIIPGDSGGIAATAAGVWAAEGAVGGGYEYGQIVQGDGSPDSKFYVCIQTHTEAHEPPDAEYWVETPWTASAANVTTPATMVWNDAIDRCLMTYAGIGPWSASNPCGWRLPNYKELLSLVLPQRYNPAVDINYFVSANSNYMTSTTYALNNATAYVVDFNGGTAYRTNDKDTSLYYIRPVRSLTI